MALMMVGALEDGGQLQGFEQGETIRTETSSGPAIGPAMAKAVRRKKMKAKRRMLVVEFLAWKISECDVLLVVEKAMSTTNFWEMQVNHPSFICKRRCLFAGWHTQLTVCQWNGLAQPGSVTLLHQHHHTDTTPFMRADLKSSFQGWLLSDEMKIRNQSLERLSSNKL